MRKIKMCLSGFLVLVMLLTLIQMGGFVVNAATVDLATFNSKLNSFQSQKYGNNSTYVDNPGLTGGYECFGFANELALYIFGSYPTNSMSAATVNSNWTVTYGGGAVAKLCIGDIVRYRCHSIFITGINGDTIYYCQANIPDGSNKVTYNQPVSRSSLKSLVSEQLTSGGTTKTGWVAHCKQNGIASGGTHTHSYSGSDFEKAHPHKIYQTCSCGATQYTGSTRAYSSCSTCMKVSTTHPKPIKAYTLATGKTTVYSSVNGSAKTNKIYDTDLCTINTMYDCGWCKVTFPLDAGGTETGYVKTSVFFSPTYSVFKVKAAKQITTYSRKNLSASIGYAASGDTVYVIGHSSTAVQIAYPLTGGGYKAGWVPISALTSTVKYNANGGSGTMSNTSAKYQGTITLTANKFTKTGHTFAGWNVYRSSDKKWYCGSNGWQTASNISTKGYSKTVYKDSYSATASKAWFTSGTTNDTLTFYA
ncbi:MAG: InlB B-repeat-containing protein, partial [Clostridia bacterium]|nr:InlB B-repeat-containing protein [Clostridia bacterium]